MNTQPSDSERLTEKLSKHLEVVFSSLFNRREVKRMLRHIGRVAH
jgi:hypothetical protein